MFEIDIWGEAEPLNGTYRLADTPAKKTTELAVSGCPGETLSASIMCRANIAVDGVEIKGHYVSIMGGWSMPRFTVKHVCPMWRAGVAKFKTDTPVLVPSLLTNHPRFVIPTDPGVNIFETDYTDSAELLPVDLQADTSHQFWLDIDIDEKCTPGVYVAEFELTSGGVLENVLPVIITVLPIRLQPPAIKYGMSFRGRRDPVDHPDYKTAEHYAADLENMYRHGVRDVSCYEDLKSPKLSEVLDLRERHGMSNDPLRMINVTVANYGDDTPEHEAKRKIEFLQAALVSERIGCQITGFALDERRGDDITRQLKYWHMAHDIGLPFMATSWDAIDLWEYAGAIPDTVLLHGPMEFHNQTLTDKIADRTELNGRWRDAGKEVLVYPLSCMLNPVAVRLQHGWYAYFMGYGGVFPYVYQERRDGSWWDDWGGDGELLVHAFARPGSTGPVNDIAIKAYMAAMNDARYIATMNKEGFALPPVYTVYDCYAARRFCIKALMEKRFKS